LAEEPIEHSSKNLLALKPNADINNDGTVNIRDIQIVIKNFDKARENSHSDIPVE
jgi:hypothetical protein